MGCPTSIVPGYSDTNKIKNKPLEMKLEREMAKTTDYFRETYGKDAKITHIDVPKKGLDKYKVNDTEYVIPEGLARKS